MRHVLYLVLILAGALACTSENAGNDLNSADVKSLQDEIALLKSENLKKDSLVTESITYFNEIERNLSNIELKEKEIRSQFSDLKASKQNGKEIILEKIKYINDLRLENGRKMYSLQQKLDTIDVAQNEFKEILKRLQLEINQKDKEMTVLQQMLEQKDQQYTKLFADYQKQVTINKERERQSDALAQNLNTAYYTVGSQKELKNNNVISISKKGFSKRIFLNDNFNESSFTPLKMDETKEINFEGKKVALITDHPESSYQLVNEAGNMKLKITNPSTFWKVSRYLVIVVD